MHARDYCSQFRSKKCSVSKQEKNQIETQVYSAFGYINVTKDLCVNCIFQLDEDSINVISIDT